MFEGGHEGELSDEVEEGDAGEGEGDGGEVDTGGGPDEGEGAEREEAHEDVREDEELAGGAGAAFGGAGVDVLACGEVRE